MGWGRLRYGGRPQLRTLGQEIFDTDFTRRIDFLICISRIKHTLSTSDEVFKLSRRGMERGLESRQKKEKRFKECVPSFLNQVVDS